MPAVRALSGHKSQHTHTHTHRNLVGSVRNEYPSHSFTFSAAIVCFVLQFPHTNDVKLEMERRRWEGRRGESGGERGREKIHFCALVCTFEMHPDTLHAANINCFRTRLIEPDRRERSRRRRRFY